GIRNEDKEKVFDMFYSLSRGDNQTSHGVELAICRGMIGAHGGHVAALNNPDGKGTLMRISLPLNSNTTSGS
ncbi:Osmosensitive K+ channel histidine kinase KdpD, partial [Methylophaga lonarensis MPL]